MPRSSPRRRRISPGSRMSPRSSSRTASRCKAGDRLVQTDLAATLQAIADGGRGRLLQGRDRGGRRRGERSQWRHPDQAGFRRLHGARDARRSAAAIAATRSSRRRRRARAARRSARSSTSSKAIRWRSWATIRRKAVHYIAEAMRHAFVDRNFLLGDPDFVDNPVERLLSEDYAAAIRATIDCRQGGDVEGRAARDARRMKAPRRRIIRSSTRTATRWR